MRSLQMKFSALVVGLLLLACVGLALISTKHERAALEDEIAQRGQTLVANLAGNAKEPLLAGDDLTLDGLVKEVGHGEGVVGVRLLDREDQVLASLDPDERGQKRPRLSIAASSQPRLPTVVRARKLLLVAMPVAFRDVLIGEAQVELDLGILVDPVVRESRKQLAAVASGVIVIGVGSGLVFVAFLAGPLRRLRAGVERLTKGDLTARVPPTSRDEVGELTRAFNEMGESLQQKERIQSAFGRYVSDYVLNQLLQTPDGDELSGAEREVTILFADIRRFTRLSEGMKARDVVGLLNDVFQLLSDRILARGGTIDKFIGDSVMAYFGAPAAQPDHALRAVAAAEDIVRAVAERNLHLAGKGPTGETGEGGVMVDVGIGIHSGLVVVGNIGSDRRTDFTAIGDAVNVAHRLEKLARPREILVSEAVQRRVRGAFRLRFEGERQLSGRVEPVHVYAVELDGPPEEAASL
ncbi:MAG TPA: adenylate/guanylate cyclase domain-containing protein [Myxococcota bacterium]|nr:adenylate/guanylate cyclase domain-containing protein [Myxococcota bacterium]